MNFNNLKKDIIVIITFIFIGINLLLFIPFSYAQTNGDSLTVNSNFNLLELGEDKGDKLNISTLDFSLPSDTWNLTNVELNFTDIKFKREVYSVEDKASGHPKLLDKQERGYAVQINITEPTEIYGVHIYGDETKAATTTTLHVQINGYDSISDQPNNTVYGSTSINMTNQTKWHIHKFSAPIILTQGYYYLVVNGSEMLPFDPAKYYWDVNDIDPNNPSFYSWLFVGGAWISNFTGEPFLYKIDQKVINEFYPNEINMTVKIGEDIYPISDGINKGTGYLNTSLNFSPETDNFSIPIINNKSFGLIYNLSYNLELKNYLNVQGNGEIGEDSQVSWILTPNIVKHFDQYSVRFDYPRSWHNFSVLRKTSLNWVNINPLIDFDEVNKYLIIPHDVIIDGAEWKIEIYSPNIDFNLEMAITKLQRGDELEFSVNAPITQGNLTFLIIKPSGKEELIEIKESVSGLNFFSYEIPLNWTEGTYIGEIYWNNHTDIGMRNQEFQILIPPIPFTLEPWMIGGLIFSIIGISIAGIMSYRTVNSFRNKKIEEKQKLYNSCIDILNLDYLMVTDKRSGLNVYTQNFVEKKIDASLISGFLQAIHSFGIELIKVEDQSQIIKLEYKDSIVLMSEFVNVRLILIMKERPSRFFLYSIEELTYDVYKNFGTMIDSFNGDVKQFQSIENLLKQHLDVSFIYPLRITPVEKLDKMRITQNERLYINKAVSVMKTNNQEHFLIKSILSGKECSPKDVEVIFKLIEKKVFQLV